jgi:phytoene synthase
MLLGSPFDPATLPEPVRAVVDEALVVLRARGVDVRWLVDLVDANLAELEGVRIRDVADLRRSCRRSAVPVGRVVLELLGIESPERAYASDEVCTGLQLVEHLEDVREDLARSRVYLPASDLADHGCELVPSDEHLHAESVPGHRLPADHGLRGRRTGRFEPSQRRMRQAHDRAPIHCGQLTQPSPGQSDADRALAAVVRFEAQRARLLLAWAGPLVAGLPLRQRLAIAAYAAGGLAALDALEREGFHPPSAPSVRRDLRRRVGLVRHSLAIVLGRRTPLGEAYAICECVTRSEARNFWAGIRILPREKRRTLTAVYAFARRIDDLADGTLAPDVKLQALERLRRALHASLERPGSGEPDPTAEDATHEDTASKDATIESSDEASRGPQVLADPVLFALADAVARAGLPHEALEDLVDGCVLDARGWSPRTTEDLERYCRLVAGSVGRLCVAAWGSSDPVLASALAEHFGTAFQLTNVLRDRAEDAARGRSYLPSADVSRFGDTAVVDALITRARTAYAQGLELANLLRWRPRASMLVMASIYRALLERIARDPAAAESTRVELAASTKIRLALAALLRSLAPRMALR